MKNIKYIISLGVVLSIISLSLVFKNLSPIVNRNIAFSLWPFYSSENSIISYSIRKPVFTNGIIKEEEGHILVDLPSNVYTPDMISVIKVSPGASVELLNDRLDTSKVNRYLVTAENGETREYEVVFLGTPFVDLPNKISSCEDLQDIKYDLSANYYLTSDIDCSSTKDWNDGYGFEPINYFKGTFDGDGHKIKNVYINRTNTDDYVGIFGSLLEGSKIVDFGVENINVRTGRVIGRGSLATGGVVGYNSGEISDVYVDGDVSSKWTAGGLVGSNQGKIENSYSKVNVEWRGYHTKKDYYPSMGGLVGDNTGIIRDSYSLGDVKSLLYNFTTDYNRLGGLVGENRGNGFVYSSYSIGKILSRTSDSINGGLIGSSVATSSSDSFWDVNTSGIGNSAGGAVGKTTIQMKDINTYSNWNLDSIWNLDITVNNGYPHLK